MTVVRIRAIHGWVPRLGNYGHTQCGIGLWVCDHNRNAATINVVDGLKDIQGHTVRITRAANKVTCKNCLRVRR